MALSVELRFRFWDFMPNALERILDVPRGLTPSPFRVDAFNARGETHGSWLSILMSPVPEIERVGCTFLTNRGVITPARHDELLSPLATR